MLNVLRCLVLNSIGAVPAATANIPLAAGQEAMFPNLKRLPSLRLLSVNDLT